MRNPYTYHINARSEVDSLYLPWGSSSSVPETYGYDDDGALNLQRVAGPSGLLRNTSLERDARGKITRSMNAQGSWDTTTVTYSGIGHVVHSIVTAYKFATNGSAAHRYSTDEAHWLDALGNVDTTQRATAVGHPLDFPDQQSSGPLTFYYDTITGRLNKEKMSGIPRVDTTLYDAAGNTELVWQSLNAPNIRERRSYYAADGTLQAVDFRVTPTWSSISMVFDEYRYDALGRRVLVWSRRKCYLGTTAPRNDECKLSLIRRTVWDGSNVLWEIQQPGSGSSETMENDTEWVSLQSTSNGWDPNPFFGRVVYTHGPQLTSRSASLGSSTPMIPRISFLKDRAYNGRHLRSSRYGARAGIRIWDISRRASEISAWRPTRLTAS